MKEKKKPSTIRTIAGLALWLVVIVLIFRACNKPNTDPKAIARKNFDKEISAETALFGKFANDATGRWRRYIYWAPNNVADYAVDYYKAYFESDDEVHFAINKHFKTTTRITKVGNLLSVAIYEYEEGEENDVKRIPSGMKYAEYLVNIDTGESEQIE
jgi:hypothetical protein